MVTVSLRRGITTVAFFQKASSVGLMSGSAVIAARTSSSVMVRRRFQSVPGSVFEVLPEVSSFMGFGTPCRYQLSLVRGASGVAVGDDQQPRIVPAARISPQRAARRSM